MSTAYSVGQTEVEFGSATGTFYRIPPAAPGTPSPSACTTTTTGACTVNACTFGGAPKPDGGTATISYTDAGPVKVSGVLVNDGTMTMTPGGYGYITTSGSVAFFTGGETVKLAAPGNPKGAPAFDVTLSAPASVTVSSPIFDSQGKVTVANGQGITVKWSGGGAGEVAAQISAGTSGKSAVARCAFPAASGQGLVPASVLGAVKAVGSQTSILVSTENRSIKNPDGWDITITLQAYALKPQGNGIASGLLQFQ